MTRLDKAGENLLASAVTRLELACSREKEPPACPSWAVALPYMVRSQKSKVRSRKSEVKSQKSKVGSQKSKVRSQKREEVVASMVSLPYDVYGYH